MSHPANSFLCGQDVYALAPFLDLLNHRPDVQVNCWNVNNKLNVNDSLVLEWVFHFFQVKASFNNVTRCYEITTVAGIQRFHQAFINYGSHDNQRLLLEYGFMAPCNHHSVVYVDSGELSTWCVGALLGFYEFGDSRWINCQYICWGSFSKRLLHFWHLIYFACNIVYACRISLSSPV